jgi:hypothetical protein
MATESLDTGTRLILYDSRLLPTIPARKREIQRGGPGWLSTGEPIPESSISWEPRDLKSPSELSTYCFPTKNDGGMFLVYMLGIANLEIELGRIRADPSEGLPKTLDMFDAISCLLYHPKIADGERIVIKAGGFLMPDYKPRERKPEPEKRFESKRGYLDTCRAHIS